MGPAASRLPKWGVAGLAALIFVPLSADWIPLDAGTRLAVGWLGGGAGGGVRDVFPLWRWLVGLAGRDAAEIGLISLGAGLVCVWLVASIFSSVFGAALRRAAPFGTKEFPLVENAATLLSGLSFAVTPGILVAATRISPLTVALLPLLAAVALAVRPNRMWLVPAIPLAGYSAYELFLARRFFLPLAVPALGTWLAVGVAPALAIAWCLLKQRLVARRGLALAFGGWLLLIAGTAIAAIASGRFVEGRDLARRAEAIVASAVRGGKCAVVSDGELDDLFFFLLPERVKLISLAKEGDPDCGRELAAWVRKIHPWLERRGTVTANVEDLVFAAELGPRALVGEWTALDRVGFNAAVATAESGVRAPEDENAARTELAASVAAGRDRVIRDISRGDAAAAERDAIELLRVDRHNLTATMVIGRIASMRGDYERAERFLRRAVATGKAPPRTRNALVRALAKNGKLEEAEPLARAAVKEDPGSCSLHGTLAEILIRRGRAEEGEWELQVAEDLLEKAGRPADDAVDLEIVRARLFWEKHDLPHFRMTMRALRARKGLSDRQRAEIKGLDW